MPDRRVAILQSNYIPWKGYFDIMADVDDFVLLDDVQFTRRDWRNRNKIKTPQGLIWLTVPVQSKGRYEQSIAETLIDGSDWAAKHLRSLQANYAKAPFFGEIMPLLEPAYRGVEGQSLSQLNRTFIDIVASYLGLETKVHSSADFDLPREPSERLLSICKALGASTYLSGPAAKDYLDTDLFARAGISVEWAAYSKYPTYPQLWGEFEHQVSILDVMFNLGPDTATAMKSVG